MTMWPNFWAIIAGRTCRVQANEPRTLTPMTRSKRFISVSASDRQCSAPALLTRKSTRPKRSSACFTIASTAASSRTSTGTASARRPSASISRAVSPMVPGNFGSATTVLAATTTSHPSAASRSASTLPTPRDAPVTTATLFANRISPTLLSPLLPLPLAGEGWGEGKPCEVAACGRGLG